jgi:large subunit ribosomal protein L20
MPRVKRGTIHVKKRRKMFADAKGYKWGRKNLSRLAKTATTKAGAHAFAHRRKKKGDFRALWHIRINAFIREHGLSYSRFMDTLKKNSITINRKMLADLAVNNKKVLAALVEKVK